MKHVPPHRWIDAAEARLSTRRVDEMNAHAETCARCQNARAQALAARATMTELRSEVAPELAWDEIRAKIRWELSPAGSSSARLAAPPEDSGARWGLAGALAAAVAVAAVVAGGDLPAPRRMTLALAAARPTPAVVEEPGAAAPAPAPTALVALVTRARGAVQVDGEGGLEELFARRLPAGAVLASGEGLLDVQLGPGTALTLGPRSSARLARLDSAAVELYVDGSLELEVAPRAAGQRFLVHAGAQTVEVRGTRFRVEHREDQTYVSCRHGLVAVREGARSVEVPAGRAVSVRTGQPMPAPSELSAAELLELAVTTPYQVAWDDVSTVAGSTSRLELTAAPARRLRLDGVELGAGAATVRVARGRHLVEASDGGGPFRRVGWAVVDARAAVRFEAGAAEPARSQAASQRREQLRALLDRSRLARCVRPIAKQGLGATYVDVELAVGRDGTVSFLNITDTDLPAELAECVRTVVASVRFAAGPAATIVEHLAL
ncbi:MAG: FecR family protein [Kofleriaceae bacterium]